MQLRYIVVCILPLRGVLSTDAGDTPEDTCAAHGSYNHIFSGQQYGPAMLQKVSGENGQLLWKNVGDVSMIADERHDVAGRQRGLFVRHFDSEDGTMHTHQRTHGYNQREENQGYISSVSASRIRALYAEFGAHNLWLRRSLEALNANSVPVDESFDNLIKQFVDAQATSQDRCPAQLLEAKQQMNTLHGTVRDISEQVNATEISIRTKMEEVSNKQTQADDHNSYCASEHIKCHTNKENDVQMWFTLRQELQEMHQIANANVKTSAFSVSPGSVSSWNSRVTTTTTAFDIWRFLNNSAPGSAHWATSGWSSARPVAAAIQHAGSSPLRGVAVVQNVADFKPVDHSEWEIGGDTKDDASPITMDFARSWPALLQEQPSDVFEMTVASTTARPSTWSDPSAKTALELANKTKSLAQQFARCVATVGAAVPGVARATEAFPSQQSVFFQITSSSNSKEENRRSLVTPLNPSKLKRKTLYVVGRSHGDRYACYKIRFGVGVQQMTSGVTGAWNNEDCKKHFQKNYDLGKYDRQFTTAGAIWESHNSGEADSCPPGINRSVALTVASIPKGLLTTAEVSEPFACSYSIQVMIGARALNKTKIGHSPKLLTTGSKHQMQPSDSMMQKSADAPQKLLAQAQLENFRQTPSGAAASTCSFDQSVSVTIEDITKQIAPNVELQSGEDTTVPCKQINPRFNGDVRLTCTGGSIVPEFECVLEEISEECLAQKYNLEQTYAKAFVELTRLVSEYGRLANSTVCIDTIKEECSETLAPLETAIETLDNEIAEHMDKLALLKGRVALATRAEVNLRDHIADLSQKCQQMDDTVSSLDKVREVIHALASCPSLTEAEFPIPLWTGEFVEAELDTEKNTDEELDQEMNALCASRPKINGLTPRAAETSELEQKTIEGAPLVNTAPVPLLGKCPNCKGKPDEAPGGRHKSGNYRRCWDPSVGLDSSTLREDCDANGKKAILCVIDRWSST